MGVSGFSTDARGGERSSRVVCGFLCGAGGSDLQIGRGDGEGVLAIRFGMDVSHTGAAAGFGSAVHRKRRRETRWTSVRSAVARLLDAPFRAGSEGDWADVSDGKRDL